MSDEQDIRDALETLTATPGGKEGSEKVWCALARVDEDAVIVLQEGPANGRAVECMIVDGPWTGTSVVAICAGPLGSSWESRPIRKGMRVLLNFLDGTQDGTCIAVAAVQGGIENPIPKSMAGVSVEDGALDEDELYMPPKGVNVRWYLRGGVFLIRLKGDGSKNKADGTPFVGEFAVECDDGVPAEPGTEARGSAMRFVWDSEKKKMVFKARTADGANIEIADGTVSMTSPNAANTVQVSDLGTRILGASCTIDVGTIILNGMILENIPPGVPPLPALSALFGASGVAGLPSLAHFIGQ